MRAAGGGTGMRSRRPRLGPVNTTEKKRQEMPARRMSWRVTHSSSSDDSQTTGDGDRRRAVGAGGGAGAGTKPTVAFQ